MGTSIFPLGEMLKTLGTDAVRIQEDLDRAYEADLARFAHPVRALHAVLGDAATGLVPARLAIGRHDVDVRLELSRERLAGGALSVRLLNRSHDLLYARSAEAAQSDCRMRITVTQVPATAAG